MDDGRFELGKEARRRVADAYLPDRRNYWYARCKLASDPLYRGVGQALAESDAPILDLGCGIGLLAQTLAAGGLERSCIGLDSDAGKIRRAEAAAQRAGLQRVRFACVNLAERNIIRAFGHQGSVVMLDLLQYVPPSAQGPILEQAAAAVSDTGRLVIRTGLAGTTWRASITRLTDSLSHKLGWMNTGPQNYPEKETLQTLLATAGLASSSTPLWGGSPFNNWLIQARRAPTKG